MLLSELYDVTKRLNGRSYQKVVEAILKILDLLLVGTIK